MELVTPENLDAYLRDDATLRRLDEASTALDETFTTQRWLRESQAKRMIYHRVYGDLFDVGLRPRVLDIGGGYTSLTRLLARHMDYTLLELMSHDSGQRVREVERELDQTFLVEGDWFEFDGEPFDVIIANDLFPNVDQRLEVFLQRYLPRCREMRLSLTFYNSPRWYQVRRVDGDELFHMLAWDGQTLGRVLSKYEQRLCSPNLSLLATAGPSVYANGRQVCLVSLRGDLSS